MHSNGIHATRLLTVSQLALGRGCVYPSMHWAEGCLPRGVCPGGSAQGGGLTRGGCVSAQRGVCLPWRVCPGGVCLPRGVCLLWGGGVADIPSWIDRHLLKHNLRKLRLGAVIINVNIIFNCTPQKRFPLFVESKVIHSQHIT